jgi:hypothetical protein
VPAALLVLLPFGLFWRALSGTLVVAGYDLVLYTYPYRAAAAAAFRHGRLPLWNPDIFIGVPFLANIPSAVLYPPNLLFVWPGGPQMLTASIVVHLVLTGLFFYAFCRVALGLGRAPSLLGALAFAASGFAIAHSEQLNQNNALAWVPAVVLAADRAYRTRRLVWIAVLALVLALEIFAGHPQEVYYTGLLTVLWLAVLVVGDRRDGVRAIAIRVASPLAGVALGALIAAVQLGPTAELSRYGIRSGGLPWSEATAFAMPAHGILGNLLPDYGTPLNTEWAGYVGLVAVLLALYGVARRWRTPWVACFGVAVILALLLATGAGTPLYAVAYHVLPGLSLFRVPARILLISTFALGALAALGASEIDRFVRQRPSWRGLWPLLTGPVLLIVFILAWGLQLRGAATRVLRLFPQPVLTRQLLVWTGLLVLTTAAIILARRVNREASPALALLVAVELFLAAQPLNPLHPLPAAVYAADASLQTFLPSDHDPARSLSFAGLGNVKLAAGLADPRYRDFAARRTIDQPDLPMQSGRATADGYEGGILPLKTYVNFRALLLPPGNVNQPDFPFLFLSNHPLALPLLGLLNVRDILVDAQLPTPIIYLNPAALPRAWLVHAVTSSRGDAADLRTIGGSRFDPGQQAITTGVACPASPPPTGEQVVVTRNDPEAVDIGVDASSPALLVVSSAFYPGWTATVDDRPTPVGRVDTLVEGVCVPSGTHVVRLRFSPTRWPLYVAASGLGLALALGLLVAGLRGGGVLFQTVDRRRERLDHLAPEGSP